MTDHRQNANSNTALFLMELIVVIGFFSLVSVICVRLFVAASVASTNSVNLNHATRAIESLADAWTACDSDLNGLSALYPGAKLSLSDPADPYSGVLTIGFDENWQPESYDDSTPRRQGFVIYLRAERVPAASVYGPDAAGDAVTAAISSLHCADGTAIGSLTVDHYLFLTETAGEGSR
ncbi:MAG: hypothetical protein II800_09875 [Lachnospiraceae bacterium]|nr:hypothetical protein [Lachnospiraceae bacterium]